MFAVMQQQRNRRPKICDASPDVCSVALPHTHTHACRDLDNCVYLKRVCFLSGLTVPADAHSLIVTQTDVKPPLKTLPDGEGV